MKYLLKKESPSNYYVLYAGEDIKRRRLEGVTFGSGRVYYEFCVSNFRAACQLVKKVFSEEKGVHHLKIEDLTGSERAALPF